MPTPARGMSVTRIASGRTSASRPCRPARSAQSSHVHDGMSATDRMAAGALWMVTSYR
ncbi:Uncharacterised protein [Mycobacteroides abscessus subsp. abscessus]|nr:Uncharacterised protein [Mycobacteroides abscessus subsp. abscessus]